MKKLYTIVTTIIILILAGASNAQNIFPANGSTGMGTLAPDASSMLEINSTTKGMLIPRMTKTQRDAIATPATGLMIYQTNNTPGFYYYDGGAWKQMTPAGVNKSLSNLSTPTAVNTDFLPGNDALMNLGSSSLYWRSAYLSDIRFKDGTMQTSALNPYAAGTGISITGNLITNIGDTNALDDVNLSLANLSATSINQSLVPNADNSKDLGASSFGWKDLYMKGGIYFAGIKAISFGETDNTIVGINAGASNTGTSNSFFGKSAGQANSIGYQNAFFGQNVGYSNTTGSYNAFFGRSAGYSNSTGSSNSFFGNDAGHSNSTADNNSFFGKSAGYANTTGYSNSFFGGGAGYGNSIGYNNSFFGENAGASNTSGNFNSFFGQSAGALNMSGGNNSFFGQLAGQANTTGDKNSFIGQAAGYKNTIGYSNSFFGQAAGSSTTTGYQNCFLGVSAGSANSSGWGNVFLGDGAGSKHTTGNGNVFIGRTAGNTVVTGMNNTCVGTFSNIGISNLTNATAIGNFAVATASNQARIGNSSVTSIGGYADWSNISDGRFKKNIKQNVPGLAFINKLKPVTYNLDITRLREFIAEDVSYDTDGKKTPAEPDEKIKQAIQKKEAMIQTGFVAQDVEKAAKELGYDFSGVDKPENDNSPYALRYSEFVVPLVKAVQELSTQNDDLKKQNDAQQKINTDLQKQINELKTLLATNNTTSSVVIQQINSVSQTARLEQNQPNPASSTTVIKYFVPEQTSKAFVRITNSNGQEIKSITLSTKNSGQLNLQTSDLTTGTYFYSLIADGKTVATKKMVIAH